MSTLKKITASAALAMSAVGVTAAVAPTAMASGDEGNSANFVGNASTQSIGTTSSGGYMSPNMAVVNGGALNCFDIQKLQANIPVDVVQVVGVPVGVQDLLNPQANQTCTQESTQQKGDDPLSHILSNVLSQNGNA